MAGMSSGMARRYDPGLNPFDIPTAPVSNPIANQYKLYQGGVEQNAEDYGSIMGGYKNLLAQAQSPSAHSVNALNNLSDLSRTGGYSDADKADIRARGISPIRSVYANAQRNIGRQRTLQGGYSPNYSALQAKMARELSGTISDKVTDINAGLAEKVAGNKLGIAGTYASASQQGNQPAQQALSGMTSLYGTTPAMAATFGNQALQGAQLQNQGVNQQNQQGLQAVANMRRRG